MKFAAFIDVLGGTVKESDFPNFMDDEAVGACMHALWHVQWQSSYMDRALGLSTDIEFVNSPFFTCRTKEIEPHHYAIAIPLGLVCRVYVMAHLLCAYLDLHAKQTFLVLGRLDAQWEERWRLPADLEPLFGTPKAGQNWWRDIAELYTRVRVPAADYDAKALTALAVMFIAGHEAAHVHRRHGAAFQHLKQAGIIGSSQEEQAFKRFAETDADIIATWWILDVQQLGLEAVKGLGHEIIPKVAYFRLSFAVTMLYALYDAHRKCMGSYQDSTYQHPIIRREMFRVAAAKVANNITTAIDMSDWEEEEGQGWIHCVQCLNGLNFDVLRGTFGKISRGYNAVPVSSLHYDPTTLDDWGESLDREIAFYSLMVNLHESFGDFVRATTPEEIRFSHPDRETDALFMASEDVLWNAAWDMTARATDSR